MQFTRREFVEGLCTAVANKAFNPRSLVLEITETAMMSGGQDTVAALRRLEDVGFKISLDDFGTGYSSLAHLKDLPIHELKIDRSFVVDADQSNDSYIVKAVATLGRGLGLSVVAEGVETEQQLEMLKILHCDTYQGFLASRSLPAGEFEAFFRARAEANTKPQASISTPA